MGKNFINRLGLPRTQAAARMGVHTLSRALQRTRASMAFGMSQVQARTFGDPYVINMIAVEWMCAQVASGRLSSEGADNKVPDEMRLNTDM